MHIDIDILVYALIAAVLLGRLWAMLGTRNDNEPQRPNPFPPPQPAEEAMPMASLSRMPPVPLPPASLAGGLAQVKAADPSFDEKAFLQTARDIFPVVVAAYAKGDMASIGDMLDPALRLHFEKAAQARANEGQSAQSRVIAITDAEVSAARATGSVVFLTVRFVSKQETILRDESGAIISGVEGKGTEVIDIWTFTRDAKTPEAKWILIETRG